MQYQVPSPSIPQTNFLQVEPNEDPQLKVVSFEFSPAQLKVLQKFLPKGFTLEPFTQKRSKSPRPSKIRVTNEGKEVKKPVPVMPEVEHSIASSQASKGNRQSRKKSKKHLERKYADYEPAPSTKPFKTNNEGVKKCYGLLQKLKKHPSAAPFLVPVDPIILGCPDYYEVITDPMDLSTVEIRLKNNDYATVNHFAADIRKIWNNSFRYNAKGTLVYQMTSDIASYFEKSFKEIEHVSFNDTINSLQRQVAKLTKIMETQKTPKQTPPPNQGIKIQRQPSTSIMDRPMSMQEKKVLGNNIRTLPPEYLRGVWDIVSEGVPSFGQNREELEFDIDTLPVRVTRELQKYVKNKMALIKKQKQKQKEKENKSITIPAYHQQQQQPNNNYGAGNHINIPNQPYMGGGAGGEPQHQQQIPQQHYPPQQQGNHQIIMNPQFLNQESQKQQHHGQHQHHQHHHHHHHHQANGGMNDDIESKSSESSFISDNSQ